MAAVPDPPADARQPIAATRPGEERVLADLPLDLELAAVLAVRPDVPRGDEALVGGVEGDERVLVVALVVGGQIATLVDLRERDGAVERDRVGERRQV